MYESSDRIPFSYFLGGSKKTKKNSRKKGRKSGKRKTGRKRTVRRNVSRKSISKTCLCINGDCKCVIDKSSNTPEGLGFSPDCSPLNIMMRGADDNLYEIKNMNGKNIWELI